MQATARDNVPDFSPHMQSVFKSLLDPLKTPYCHYTYLDALMQCDGHIPRIKTSADPILQDIVFSIISFYAKHGDNPEAYTVFENRIFRQPCRCVTIFPYLHDLHRHPGAAASFKTRLATANIDNLSSIVDILSSLLDRLIWGTSNKQIPDVRAWHRKIINLMDKKSPSLIQSFTYWLRRNDKAHLFALFGTFIEKSPKMADLMEHSSAVRAAFDERFHALVTEEYTCDCSGYSPYLDLIFHGAGCVAYVFHCTMSSTGALPRFRACFALGVEQRYEDICRLLSMASRANKEIQDGTLHDLTRLALFGADLHRLLRVPLSPLITDIIEKSPQAPNGWAAFHTYFLAADRCSNPLRHSASGGNAPAKNSFTVVTKLKLKREEKLQACANCKASHFCSRMCQKEAWRGGKIPHRVVCPILAKIWKVHQAKEKLDRKTFETSYSDAGISTAEVQRAISYAMQMTESFSEYVNSD